jgi:hypothetical protein
MIGLSTAFANARMRLFGKNESIRFPEITITATSSIRSWNAFPEFAASGLTAITDDKSHNLARAPAHDRPQPAFVPSLEDK